MSGYPVSRFDLRLGDRLIRLGDQTKLMGVLNITPDSFSDGGRFLDPGLAEARALVMEREGADLIDIGGESTRPGSQSVSVREEIHRVLPVLKRLSKKINVPISIDTTKSVVARAALDLGVNIINDVSAMRFDKKMASIVARYKASLVLMHMKGTPAKMQDSPVYDDVVGEVISFLADAVKRAEDAGVDADKIIVDPGIGFGKGPGHNLEILGRLSALKSLGRPIMVGVSRKRFIGRILNAEVKERAWGTAAAVCMSIANGAGIVRVHDVNEMAQAAKVADAIVNRGTAYGR